MKSNDQKLLEEAYISALQKGVNVPADLAAVHQPDNHLSPEVGPEQPVVMSITADEPVSDCGCSADCECRKNGEHYQEEEREETSMAAANLFSIFTDAKMLHELLQNGEHLDTWMLQKIAVVADNLSSVSKVAKYHFAKGGE